MPKIKFLGQMVQTGEFGQTDTQTNGQTLPNLSPRIHKAMKLINIQVYEDKSDQELRISVSKNTYGPCV